LNIHHIMSINDKFSDKKERILIPEIVDRTSLDYAYSFVKHSIKENPENLKRIDLGYLINKTKEYSSGKDFNKFLKQYEKFILKKHNLK
jgi:hypothetical protein